MRRETSTAGKQKTVTERGVCPALARSGPRAVKAAVVSPTIFGLMGLHYSRVKGTNRTGTMLALVVVPSGFFSTTMRS